MTSCIKLILSAKIRIPIENPNRINDIVFVILIPER